MTRICRICKQEKELEEFVRHKKMKNGYDNICKKCNTKKTIEYCKKYPQKTYGVKHREKDLKRKRIDASKRRKVVRDFIHNYKKNKQCLICGYSEDTDILVFHHRNPEEKKYKISQRNTSNPNILINEIEKCDLFCPNCHRELHWKEIQNNLKENISEITVKKRKYQKWFNDLKKDGCDKCGEKRFYVLDYHHIENNKEHEIHKMVQARVAKKKLLEEINKCVLLCSNCHNILHKK